MKVGHPHSGKSGHTS